MPNARDTEPSRGRRATVVVAVAAVLAALLWWAATGVGADDGVPQGGGPERAGGARPPLPAVDEVAAALADPRGGGRLLVIGDSTGDQDGEWVALTARHLGDGYDRPVVLRHWDLRDGRYRNPVRIPGSGRVLAVDNFSASGKDPRYSARHLDAAAAERPDLVLISHGHNTGEVRVQLEELFDALMDRWTQPPAVAVILQNPRTDAPQQGMAAAADVRAFAADHPGVGVIDVRREFAARGVDGLLADGLHPTAAGSRLWAETVWAALGI